jgi:hypothetical protein
MPWKTRKGSRYYYRSIRDGDRVRTEYIGAGPAAELIAQVDRLDPLERERSAEAWRECRRADEAADRSAALAFGRVELVARAALEAAGFHRHRRQWRRGRMGELSKAPDAAGPPGMPGARAEILDVLTRAAGGDESAMPRLREMFRDDPARMIKVSGGDLAAQVEAGVIRRLAGANLGAAHALELKLQSLREELAGPDAPAIERLLAERVALGYLDCHAWELYHDTAMRAAEGLTFRQAAHYQRMRDRAHGRYMKAMRTLAAVRKLGSIAVQVSVEHQQINIGDGAREKAPSHDPSTG